MEDGSDSGISLDMGRLRQWRKDDRNCIKRGGEQRREVSVLHFFNSLGLADWFGKYCQSICQ